MTKREINNELANVWGIMLNNKLNDLQKKQQEAEAHIAEHAKDNADSDYSDGYETGRRYGLLTGTVNGIISALTLFGCLEDGKYAKEYDEIAGNKPKTAKTFEPATAGETYIVQTKIGDEMFTSMKTASQIIEHISMSDCHDSEIMVYRSSSFSKIEPLTIHGTWHDFADPLYIKVTDADDNVVFDGYGSDH